MRIYVCMYVYIYIYTYIYIYICIYLWVCIHTDMYAHTMCVCMYIHIEGFSIKRTRMYASIYIYTYIYIYIYIYTHTHLVTCLPTYLPACLLAYYVELAVLCLSLALRFFLSAESARLKSLWPAMWFSDFGLFSSVQSRGIP